MNVGGQVRVPDKEVERKKTHLSTRRQARTDGFDEDE
jgi:hypothetical protein